MASRRIEDLDRRFQPLVRALFERSAGHFGPYEAFITDGVRSHADQERLYAQGRSTPGKIVTNAKPGESSHNHGLAVDIAFKKGSDGKTYYNPELYATLFPYARELGIVLGADWPTFPDAPHFEYPDWKRARSDPNYVFAHTLEPIPPMADTSVIIDLPFQQLCMKYGVSNILELDARITEHVGVTWGAEDRPGGGHLAAERRKNTELTTQLEIANQLAQDRQKDIVALAQLLDLPVTADIAAIRAEITKLLSKEDDLAELDEKMKTMEAEHVREVMGIKHTYESQAQEIQERLDRLQGNIEQITVKTDVANWLTSFVSRIFKR